MGKGSLAHCQNEACAPLAEAILRIFGNSDFEVLVRHRAPRTSGRGNSLITRWQCDSKPEKIQGKFLPYVYTRFQRRAQHREVFTGPYDLPTAALLSPSGPIRWRTAKVWMPAVLHPFHGVVGHVTQAKRIRLATADDFGTRVGRIACLYLFHGRSSPETT